MIYQETKGATGRVLESLTQELGKLDTKLQKETDLTAQRIDERIKSLDDKLQIESRLVAGNSEKSLLNQEVYATDMRTWRLNYVEKTSEFQGKVKSQLEMLEKELASLRELVQTAYVEKLKILGGGSE